MLAQQIDLFRGPASSAASIVDEFVDELMAFSFNGNRTVVEKRDGIDFFFNEFWTARQRQANRLHEISYRACFKPQLPQFFIQRLTAPGETVYDPFMGRGATPLELMERVTLEAVALAPFPRILPLIGVLARRFSHERLRRATSNPARPRP